jgi:hypothetical protein
MVFWATTLHSWVSGYDQSRGTQYCNLEDQNTDLNSHENAKSSKILIGTVNQDQVINMFNNLTQKTTLIKTSYKINQKL